jgi:hypothetical protein
VAVLLSVNVGKPKEVSWQGRTVYTGAWKEQVLGPRMGRRLNIDGDGQVPLARLWHAVPCFPSISEVWLRLLEAYRG